MERLSSAADLTVGHIANFTPYIHFLHCILWCLWCVSERQALIIQSS